MNEEQWTQERRREWQAQERARALELAGAPGTDEPLVDRYRAVVRLTRTAPRSPVPADFAAKVAAAAREQEFDERFERWMLRIGGLIAVAFTVFYMGDSLLDIGQLTLTSIRGVSPSLPLLSNPMLWVAIVGTACATLFDLPFGAGRRTAG